MSTHPEYNDLMVEALYGEIAPEDRRRLDEHLDACEDCAAEFAELRDTLDVMTQRERPEPPASYWPRYRRHLDARRARRTDTLTDRLRRWWASLPPLLPQTGAQWAVQGAVALLLLIGGLWGGQQLRPSGPAALPEGETPASVLRSAGAERGGGQPVLRGVDNITFDVQEGTVSIRYRTASRVTVRGRPEDPTIRRLLRAALLDDTNPASQLHAIKTLERGTVAPSADLVQALTYLVRKERTPSLRLRAVRALRALHQNRPMGGDTRSVLLDLLLDPGADEALRVEALQTLVAPPSRLDPSALYPVRDDSNSYLRYQARTALRDAQALAPVSN
jgi:hypothetical protein